MKGTLIKRRYAVRHGFSLLEISLVVVLIGLLTAGAAVALLGRAQATKIRITKSTMNLLKGQISSYMAEGNGAPPASLQVLVDKQYVEKSTLKDAWKQDFYYNPQGASAGQPYTLISFGPDLQAGTADDIDVWTMDITSDE
ncbi:MAG: prepilin-type N-terminal cleavage/methylation domain-containing protein [Planctomycetota bacterium]|nr:MAG: prepilin-type N-terminal cleavage/methylation domain-containing protein [Planctomycetota bacterium]